MAPKDRPKPEWVRLGGRYALLARGEITVDDLDDEELARGRLKDKNGNWSGRPPKMIPADLANAIRKAWIGRAEEKLREALLDSGIGVLVSLANNELIDPSVRLRAAERIIERTMGKVPDRVQLSAEDPVETLFRSILSDPLGLAPHEPTAEERQMLS